MSLSSSHITIVRDGFSANLEEPDRDSGSDHRKKPGDFSPEQMVLASSTRLLRMRVGCQERSVHQR
jgi:hypothetical protein